MSRKYYAKFFRKDLTSDISPLCGSDSIYYLDGRHKLSNKMMDATERALALNKNHGKEIVAISLRNGNQEYFNEITYILLDMED